MALVVYWYDIVCFAIVGLAIAVSTYVLWRKEGTGACREKSLYESLFIPTSSTAEELDKDYYFASASGLPTGYVSSLQLWTSCWRTLHPAWLLGIRVLSFSVLAAFLSCDIQQWGISIFMYYTEWTFSLVMMYFAIGSVVSAHGCWLLHIDRTSTKDVKISEVVGHLEENAALKTKRNSVNERYVRLQSYYLEGQASQRTGFWGHLMQTAYQTCAGAVVLTDVLFWCIIVPFLSNAQLHLSLLTGCMHTLNVGFLLIDTCVNRLPFPGFRLAYFVLWSSVYVIFQWLIHLYGFTWWPYPFLELSTPWAPVWYLILAVFLVACYGSYALVVRAKDSLFSELFPHSYVRSS